MLAAVVLAVIAAVRKSSAVSCLITDDPGCCWISPEHLSNSKAVITPNIQTPTVVVGRIWLTV